MKIKTEREPRTNSVAALTPPADGGWNWVVLFSSFWILAIADGIAFTFGLFYKELLLEFGEGKGATSWVPSIMVATNYCTGPLASGLSNKLGFRVVAILGSLTTCSGLFISTFAPNINFLYFSVGIVTGFGIGLMYLPSIMCLSYYFEQKRALATGVVMCGSGVGTFLLAPIIEKLVRLYGWRGAMMFVAGFALHGCVFGALFRPLRSPPRVREEGCRESLIMKSEDKVRSTTSEPPEHEMSLMNIQQKHIQAAGSTSVDVQGSSPLLLSAELYSYPMSSEEVPQKAIPAETDVSDLDIRKVPKQRDAVPATTSHTSGHFGMLRDFRKSISSAIDMIE